MLLFLTALLSPLTLGMEMQMIAWKATNTPCCMDNLMPNVCKALYNRDHEKFGRNCRNNPDFSFLQCCHSCHFNLDLFSAETLPIPTDLYMHDVSEMLLKPNLNICFDRHGSQFCEAFVTRSSFWSRRTTTCAHSAFAFRVCRKTCGYCTSSKPATVRYNSTIARNPKMCERLF